MKDKLNCPICGHPLGFHGYYEGKCEVPVGGPSLYNKCGCNLSLHDLIVDLQAKEKAKNSLTHQQETEIRQANAIREYKELVDIFSGKIHACSAKISAIKDMVLEIKSIESKNWMSKWAGINYKKKVHEAVDKIIEEIDKNGTSDLL